MVTSHKTVAVIGAGPAGMMAAGAAANAGHSVMILEKNSHAGAKLDITGKGRCNITNLADMDELMRNIRNQAKFLLSAFARFSPDDTCRFFEALGVPLKTERGRRVFPMSDSARDITKALAGFAKSGGARFAFDHPVEGILVEKGAVSGVRLKDGRRIPCDAVILATGGRSYPKTGSTGDGYVMARALGHTVVPPVGSLVPLVSQDSFCAQMQGLSLKNTGLKLIKDGKCVFSDFGELLFTHFGVSGPMALSASAYMRDYHRHGYTIVLDLKPALTEDELDRRLISDFEKFKNRDFANSLSELLPVKMIPVVIALSGIPERIKTNAVTRAQRRSLVMLLKGFPIRIANPRPIDEAIVTAGGISTGEIDPRTMESKRIKSLYFAGEVIDVDAFTGGYNLQIAWSTGHLAGISV